MINLICNTNCLNRKEDGSCSLDEIMIEDNGICQGFDSPYGIWASETWSTADLINALEHRQIEPTKENISKLHQACIGLFDDKSQRNEVIDEKVCEIFQLD